MADRVGEERGGGEVVVFVDPSDLPSSLAAACRATLGDPAVLPWMAEEVEAVRATVDAFEAALNPEATA